MMRETRELRSREREILAAIIRHYISRGEPVGSRALAEHFPETLSSATIRSCMAELERAGFLEQPHVSAGRVPTDKAYRFYVDRIMHSTRLGRATEKFIDEKLSPRRGGREDLMEATSRVLSKVSRNVGLVMG